MRGSQLLLDFTVVNDPALFQIDQQHSSRLQTPFFDDLFFRDRQDAHFRRHDHLIVAGDQIAGRPQTVAIQGCANSTTIGEGNCSRTIPRFHQRRMVFVKGVALGIHQRVIRPGFRHHQHHGVRQRVATGQQQFQRIIKGGGVRSTVADQRPQLIQICAQLF